MPLIVIELGLVVGGVLLFGWWQLRSVRRDRQQAAADRARRTAADQNCVDQTDTTKPPSKDTLN